MSNIFNEEEYRKLCESCDRVLLGQDSSIARVAISWLHIVREHPVFLENYSDIIDSRKSIMSFAKFWLRKFRNWAGWMRQLVRSIMSGREIWCSTDISTFDTDILFVSHLLNASLAGHDNDFYFDNLHNDLAKNNLTSLIVLINHSGVSGKKLSGKWAENTTPRAILSKSLKLLSEASLYLRLRRESIRLKRLAKTEGSCLYQRVLNRASDEAMASGSHAALRIATQIGTLVAKVKPKVIVVTHEGHAWERVVFAAARIAQQSIICIGYQHSALFRLQHAVRRNLDKQYNPDQILTAGAITCTQLENAADLSRIPISVLGSNRISAASGDIKDYIKKHEQVDSKTTPICLVIPEGIISECHILFEYSLACAKLLPHIKFIWRLHPLVSFDAIMSRNHRLKTLPDNVVLSEKKIGEDIACSRWALYRGTTAVIQAVNSGLQPIYLKLPGEMTIDPLYELESWRVKVEFVMDFIHIVNTYDNKYSQSLKEDADTAKKYCENYFLPFDYKVLNKSIENSK